MKATCTVYERRERFSEQGCTSSYATNISWDPFPCGTVLPGGLVLRWPVYRFGDRWKTTEHCGFSILDKKIQKLSKKKKIYLSGDGALYDTISKQIAVLPKELWSGECNRCGRCCCGIDGIHRCKYLEISAL